MKLIKTNIFLLAIIALPLLIRSQETEYIFERITVEDGLSQSTVYSIMQDDKGFLWFATQDRGLNKYDGYHFSNYFNNPNDPNSIPTNKVSKIIQSNDGLIYIGTWGKGLCVFNPAVESFKIYEPDTSQENSISSKKAQTIYEDKEGYLWIGTADGGLNRFDRQSEEFLVFRHNPEDDGSISDDRIWDIREDQQGYLWLATSNGLNKFNKKTGKAVRYLHNAEDEQSLSHNQVRSLFIDNENTVWCGTAVSLEKFNRDEEYFEHFYFPVENIKRNSINKIFLDSRGNMWVGTHIGGLIKFNTETKEYLQFFHDPNDDITIGYNDVRDIYEDHAQNLWVATRGGGVNKLNLNPKPFYSIKNNPENSNSLSNNRVKSIIEDKHGNLWIGTDVGGGLDYYNRKTNKFYQYYHQQGNRQSIASNDVSALMEDHEGNIWVGTDGNGISILNRKTGVIQHYIADKQPLSLSNNEIWRIYQDRKGNIWIGTNNGLNKYIAEKNGFRKYFHDKNDSTTITDNCIWDIFQDSYGDLWIATENGLSRYNYASEKMKQYRNNPSDSCSLGFNTVFNIYEDKERNLWIGTANGMNLFNREREKFRCFNKDHDLVGNAIYGILEDEKNNLWVSTVNGLSRFNKETYQYRTYDIFDGLQNNDYSIGACVTTQRGELVFGGVNGVTLFFPDSIVDNNYIPPVVITDFLIYNNSVQIEEDGALKKHINYAESIELSPEQDVVSFYFAALDYTKPEKNQYQYFLEGFDKEWNFAGNRRYASYTNIPSGKYTLHVQASNNDNVWNTEGVALAIYKKPPFYERVWFYILEGIIFLLIIFLIFRLRLRSLEKDKRLLEQNVTDRTREIELQKRKLEKAYFEVQQSAKSKEIFLANTSHEIRTPLNVIIGYCNLLLNSVKHSKYLNYLNNIRSASNNLLVIINDILDFSKIEAGKLSVEEVEFDVYEVLENLTSVIRIKISDKDLNFEKNIDASIPRFLLGDPYRLNQILSNLLDNAVKFTPKKGAVKFDVQAGHKSTDICELIFIIEDTGIGIRKEKLAQIFDSFTQASPDTTRKYGGTGLGLSIVKSLVDLLKGKITVQSEPEKGTIFNISLRFKIGSGKTLIKKEDDYKISRAKEIDEIRILLVEDNLVNVTLATDTIQLYNNRIQIDVAENGKIAVEKVEKNDYELVIMDVQMPVMDGYEATKYIRSQIPGEKKYIPILGMTAHAMKEEKEKCLALGMNDYITKPFVPEELFKKIELLIEKGEQKQNTKSFVPQPVIKVTGNEYINVEVLQKIYGDDKEKILKILKLYKSNIPKQIKELQECICEKNWQNIQVVAHSLKTSFNYLNLEELKENALALEKEDAKNKDLRATSKKVKYIHKLWKSTEVKLDNTIKLLTHE